MNFARFPKNSRGRAALALKQTTRPRAYTRGVLFITLSPLMPLESGNCGAPSEGRFIRRNSRGASARGFGVIFKLDPSAAGSPGPSRTRLSSVKRVFARPGHPTTGLYANWITVVFIYYICIIIIINNYMFLITGTVRNHFSD